MIVRRVRAVGASAIRRAGFVATAVCVAACVAASPAAAQYRVIDAITLADIASGSLTALGASCKSTSVPTPGDLPPIPGLAPLPGLTPKQLYFAAAGGFGVFETDAAGLGGRGVGLAEARAHWVPPSMCRFDGFVGVNGTTLGALSATIEGRLLLLPGRAFAPALELVAAEGMGGSGDIENLGTRMVARLSATTPNLYALTIGRIGQALIGERFPKLDLRARLYAGWASFRGDYWRPLPPLAYEISKDLRVKWGGGGSYTEAGGTAQFGTLHVPVSLLVSSEHVIGGYLPVHRPRARDAIGLAYRLPGFNKNSWLVARVERRRDLVTTTSYRLEVAHLALGAR